MDMRKRVYQEPESSQSDVVWNDDNCLTQQPSEESPRNVTTMRNQLQQTPIRIMKRHASSPVISQSAYDKKGRKTHDEAPWRQISSSKSLTTICGEDEDDDDLLLELGKIDEGKVAQVPETQDSDEFDELLASSFPMDLVVQEASDITFDSTRGTCVRSSTATQAATQRDWNQDESSSLRRAVSSSANVQTNSSSDKPTAAQCTAAEINAKRLAALKRLEQTKKRNLSRNLSSM